MFCFGTSFSIIWGFGTFESQRKENTYLCDQPPWNSNLFYLDFSLNISAMILIEKIGDCRISIESGLLWCIEYFVLLRSTDMWLIPECTLARNAFLVIQGKLSFTLLNCWMYLLEFIFPSNSTEPAPCQSLLFHCLSTSSQTSQTSIQYAEN